MWKLKCNTYTKMSNVVKKKKYFRLSAVTIRQGCLSIASRDSLRYNDYILMPGRTRIRDRKIEDCYEVSPRRKLVDYVYSQLSRGVLWPRASNRQRIFHWLHERHFQRTRNLSVLRGIRVSFRMANGTNLMYG